MGERLQAALRQAGVRDARVIAAAAALDRAAFLPPPVRPHAEEDRPLPIGEGQTCSQPSLVALMTEALRLRGRERVLELGTGCGYQTALLAALCGGVWSVEFRPALAAGARRRLLDELGLANVHLRTGDGALGWPEAAPFDRILVTAAVLPVPAPLLAQLAPGGLLLAPVGLAGEVQWLEAWEKDAAGRLHERRLLPVMFVPLATSAAG